MYVGLEGVTVTRYIGDGGIDAQGNLIAGRFHIPVGIQVKRYRNNVQRPDIDKFIGALSGRFSDGMFMTTASYAPGALQKATTSIPRVLTLDGDQIVSTMVEHGLGLRPSSRNVNKMDIDSDYFIAFEGMPGLLAHRVAEERQRYDTDSSTSSSKVVTDEQSNDLKPEDDLISLNALGYALRVDPARVRRWVENETIKPLEYADSLLAEPTKASDNAVKRLIITYPLERFLIKNFIAYFPAEGILQIAPQLWQELHYYEVIDALKRVDEQISYYIARHTKRGGRTSS